MILRLAILLFSSILSVAYGKCRMDPEAAHSHCGLPDELSNFQGEHLWCKTDYRIRR